MSYHKLFASTKSPSATRVLESYFSQHIHLLGQHVFPSFYFLNNKKHVCVRTR